MTMTRRLTVLYLVVTALSSVAAFVQPRAAASIRPSRPSLSVTSTLQAPPPSSTIAQNDKDMVDEDEATLPESEKFDWFKAWYPLVPVNILDIEKPHKFELLGMPLVVWKDSPIQGVKDFQPKPKKGKRDTSVGQWRVFVDECPHRKVPLSEGRIEADGSLLCSYHGWRFDGQGSLVDVPQMQQSDDLKRVQANPKSQCNSFPVQIIDGVLWVWPQSGSDARIESALTAAKHYKLPGDRKKEDVWYGPWNFRELPYGADYFIENVVDPAHVGGT